MTGRREDGDDSASESALVRVWRSIFPRPIVPRTDRERRTAILQFFVLHLRPVRVRRSTLAYTHTFGLGGSSMVLISLLVLTGALMMFAYEPTPERAYQSVKALDSGVLFGGLVRNIHHWSANLLVVVAVAHMLRVFFTGGFHGDRRFNWVIGIALLAGVLAANFTGYLLPWDQLSYWAVTICTGMFSYVPWVGGWLQEVARGGPELGASTLILFYTLHTTMVPVLLIVMMAFHFWRVRKAGGVVDPRPEESVDGEAPDYVLTLPDLLVREVAAALALVAFVFVLAVVFDAPLGAPANPGMSTNPAKSPWYFVGFQELQLHFHPLVAVVVIPVLAALALLAIPYLRYPKPLTGPWFLTDTGRRTGRLAALSAVIITPLLIVVDEFLLQPGAGLPSLVWRGVVPLLVSGAAVVGFRTLLVNRLGASRAEVVQALFILFFVVLAVLTATGVWFRGPGMALVWPWGW